MTNIKNTKGFTVIEYPITDFAVGQALSQAVHKFFGEYIKEGKYFILLKIKYKSGKYITLHKGYIVSKDVLDQYILHVIKILDFKTDEYSFEEEYDQIGFTYFKIPQHREEYFRRSDFKTIHKPYTMAGDRGTSKRYFKYPIPLNMDYLSWGKVISKTNNSLIIMSEKVLFKITYLKLLNKIQLFVNSELSIEFKDIKISDQYFMRKHENDTRYIEVNKEILLVVTEVKTHFMTKLTKEIHKSNPKFATLAIETLVDKGAPASGPLETEQSVLRPSNFTFYDGDRAYSWLSSTVAPFFNQILRRKYDGYQIYIHNLSQYNISFLLQDLARLTQDYDVRIIKRDSNYIMIKITNADRRISITLKDSYHILPKPLNELTEQFNVSTGQTPAIALYQILNKFRDLIYNQFGILIDKYPTISSLAFAIYRSKFMRQNQIPILIGRNYKLAHWSYTGGATDVYKPTGRNVSCYDVNALYPSMMKENKFPVGKIRRFMGDIEWLYKLDPHYTKDNSYWIGFAQVETKKDLYQPYLQVHLGKEQGFEAQRTIAPNGSFPMSINCCEYENALKDYNINVEYGLLFDAANIFEDYVDNIFNMRLKYEKHEPMNYICKLLLNSLYGRFAMKPQLTESLFLYKDEQILDYDGNPMNKKNILDITPIDKDYTLVTCGITGEGEETATEVYSINSISIASAIAAYARVEMSKLKNNPKFKLLYTDTDQEKGEY